MTYHAVYFSLHAVAFAFFEFDGIRVCKAFSTKLLIIVFDFVGDMYSEWQKQESCRRKEANISHRWKDM